jgi:hypothetical protein
LPFCDKFDIDLITALQEQLRAAFKKLTPGALTEENLEKVPAEQGVYHLHRSGVLVYVGKAANLRSRLRDHRLKIKGRRNIEISEMGFTCLTVSRNWTALAPENSLIDYYKKQSGNSCEWNGKSFGPHDPGRNRETTNKAPLGFDSQFPIRDDWPCGAVTAGEWNIRDLLMLMKAKLPFDLRFEVADKKKYREGHPDYNNLTVTVPATGLPVNELLRLITQQLPGWQSTRFPSHMILYQEARNYAHGIVIWQQPLI